MNRLSPLGAINSRLAAARLGVDFRFAFAFAFDPDFAFALVFAFAT